MPCVITTFQQRSIRKLLYAPKTAISKLKAGP